MKRMVDSELINSLGNSIKFDEMGNVTVGRNLEVGGNVFTLNGKQWGIMPIFIDSNNVITSKGYIIYSDKPTIKRPQGAPEGVLNLSLQGILVGKTSDDIGIINTEYSTSVGVPFRITEDGLYFQDEDYYNRVISAAKSVKSIATKDDLSTLQPKLYRHRLRLNNLYILMYDSTSKLNAGSVDDLRTIMKISSNSDSQMLPVSTEDGTAMAPLAVTIHYCKVNGTDVTTVSDTVTSL